MSLFGEFHVPANEFVFHTSFQAHPEMVLEIERVVAADEILTPYFWVSHVSPEGFEATARDDPTIDQVQQLDTFEDATLYRAEWIDQIDTMVYAYTHVGAVILEATGTQDEWMLRLRFDDREKLDEFNSFLNEEDVSFDLRQLSEITHPHPSGEYGLTPKQYEALITAWEMGYFDLPRKTTMKKIAHELDITPQALSDRLRRAQNRLLGETLRVDDPAGHDLSR